MLSPAPASQLFQLSPSAAATLANPTHLTTKPSISIHTNLLPIQPPQTHPQASVNGLQHLFSIPSHHPGTSSSPKELVTERKDQAPVHHLITLHELSDLAPRRGEDPRTSGTGTGSGRDPVASWKRFKGHKRRF